MRCEKISGFTSKSRVMIVAALLASSFASAGGISGVWKHADEPVWIEIDLEKKAGIVIRNDVYPERVGRVLLKDLAEENPEEARWKGKIYVEKRDEYRDAKISPIGVSRMEITVKVGFISRNVKWISYKKDAVVSTRNLF